jgi:hypothetical protein
MLLDDLGRVLATPMPRSRALRLLGATLFCAIFPRSGAAANCSQQTCPPTSPWLCCLNHPTNSLASISGCCTSTQFCCSGLTPHGAAWAAVACCKKTEFCIRTDAFVKCSPCASGIQCGTGCCEVGETCLNGTCCSGDRICGNICCPPGSECITLPSKRGGFSHLCLRLPCPADRICGGQCCPPGSRCVTIGGRNLCLVTRTLGRSGKSLRQKN